MVKCALCGEKIKFQKAYFQGKTFHPDCQTKYKNQLINIESMKKQQKAIEIRRIKTKERKKCKLK